MKMMGKASRKLTTFVMNNKQKWWNNENDDELWKSYHVQCNIERKNIYGTMTNFQNFNPYVSAVFCAP